MPSRLRILLAMKRSCGRDIAKVGRTIPNRAVNSTSKAIYPCNTFEPDRLNNSVIVLETGEGNGVSEGDQRVGLEHVLF
jgi:hypothetical protein